MGDVIALADYRARRTPPLVRAMSRLERAVGRLDPLVRGRSGRLGSRVEHELITIANEVSAGHPHEAAQGKDRDSIVGSPPAKTDQARPHPDRERKHLDPQPLGDQEMPQLVDEYQEAEDQGAVQRNHPEIMHGGVTLPVDRGPEGRRFVTLTG